jgi:mono/diheme cytochrome c family protein
MTLRMTVTCAVLVLFSLLSGAAAQTRNAPAAKPDVYAPLAKAPAKAAGRINPLQSDPEAVAVGEKLFALHCAECHGQMADGGHKGPSLIADQVQQASPGTLFWILTNGVVRHGMPVWSKLPEPQRWQIVSYIRSFSPARKAAADSQKPSNPEDPAPTVEGH